MRNDQDPLKTKAVVSVLRKEVRNTISVFASIICAMRRALSICCITRYHQRCEACCDVIERCTLNCCHITQDCMIW